MFRITTWEYGIYTICCFGLEFLGCWVFFLFGQKWRTPFILISKQKDASEINNSCILRVYCNYFSASQHNILQMKAFSLFLNSKSTQLISPYNLHKHFRDSFSIVISFNLSFPSVIRMPTIRKLYGEISKFFWNASFRS